MFRKNIGNVKFLNANKVKIQTQNTDAFLVNQADGTNVFQVDTLNGTVKINGVELEDVKLDLDGFPDSLKNLTTLEINQLENINTNTISNIQWGYLGNLDQDLTTSSNAQFQRLDVYQETSPGTLFVSKLNGLDLSTLSIQADDLGQRINTSSTVIYMNGFPITTTQWNYLSQLNQNLTQTSDVKFKDLNLTGNLNVSGTTTTFNTGTVEIEDSIIELGKDNSGDVIDTGFYGVYNTNKYRGLIFDTSENKWILYNNGDTKPTTTLLGTYDLSDFEMGDLTVNSLNNITSTELSYLDGLTSNIQSQINTITGESSLSYEFNQNLRTTDNVEFTNLTVSNSVDIENDLTVRSQLSVLPTNEIDNGFFIFGDNNTVIDVSALRSTGKVFMDWRVNGGDADYDTRFERATGANGNFGIYNKGTGNIVFNQNGNNTLALSSSTATITGDLSVSNIDQSSGYNYIKQLGGNVNTFLYSYEDYINLGVNYYKVSATEEIPNTAAKTSVIRAGLAGIDLMTSLNNNEAPTSRLEISGSNSTFNTLLTLNNTGNDFGEPGLYFRSNYSPLINPLMGKITGAPDNTNGGRLVFHTARPITGAMTEAMKIDANGDISISGDLNITGRISTNNAGNVGFAPGTWTSDYNVFGSTSSTGIGLGIASNSTTNENALISLSPGVAWRPLIYKASTHKFKINNNSDDTLTIDGNGAIINANTQTLRLNGTDHTYVGFYNDGSTRDAYIGYPSAGSNQLSIVNENTGVSNADIVLTTEDTVDINANLVDISNKLQFGSMNDEKMATSGHIVLGNLIINWGITGSITTGGSAFITFNKSYNTACYGVFAQRIEASTASSFGWSTNNPTKLGFNLYSNGARTGSYFWVAIGT